MGRFGNPRRGRGSAALPAKFVTPAAEIGEHTEAILREFGLSEQDIAARLASGAVVGK